MNRGPQYWFYVAGTALIVLVFFILLFANVDFDDDDGDVGLHGQIGVTL